MEGGGTSFRRGRDLPPPVLTQPGPPNDCRYQPAPVRPGVGAATPSPAPRHQITHFVHHCAPAPSLPDLCTSPRPHQRHDGTGPVSPVSGAGLQAVGRQGGGYRLPLHSDRLRRYMPSICCPGRRSPPDQAQEPTRNCRKSYGPRSYQEPPGAARKSDIRPYSTIGQEPPGAARSRQEPPEIPKPWHMTPDTYRVQVSCDGASARVNRP